ncbi:MAG TPA: hypothetical protein VFX50_19140 [Gemmatimonadales bacterium]|nr:hypothetical protein [Gemmatimonadales bacterium]
MTRTTGLLALLLALGTAVPAAAQSSSGDRWQITLDNGEIVWDVRLKQLADDRLEVTQRDSLITVKVGEIKELRRIRKSEMQLGQGTAGAMAALTGADDEVFDLGPLDFGQRLRAVQQIVLQHPAPPADAP